MAPFRRSTPEPAPDIMRPVPAFEDAVTQLFHQQFRPLFRYLDRLCGDADLAADLAQEAFVKLYERGVVPEEPAGWLVTVATNLFRDTQRSAQRRERITTDRGRDPTHHTEVREADTKIIADEARDHVRSVLATLPLRDRQLLLLRHEGYSYRELAHMLEIEEGSVGTLLLRATRAFRTAFTTAASCS